MSIKASKIFISLAFYLGILQTTSCSNFPNYHSTGFEGKPIPQFNFRLTDSTTIQTNNDIPLGHPFVIIFFNPSCPLCQAETKDLLKHISSFQNTKVYLLSSFPIKDLRNYSNLFSLKSYPNITICQDDHVSFAQYYKIDGVPYTAIFDSEKKLKRALIGSLKATKIKSIINE